MDISAVILQRIAFGYYPMKAKSQDEPAFSQRMLENHLSQDTTGPAVG